MSILARILLSGLMACPLLNFAQNNPLFQFTLFFEDSIGNHDSIILGYDLAASLNNIDPQFGEVVLSEPFDSVFEVRAIHFNDSYERTVKVLIERGGTLGCVAELGAILIINAKFPPIKITYDSTLFPLGACGNVVLSPHWGIFTLPEWWDACEYYCLGSSSEYIEDLIPPSPQCWNYLHVEKEVAGQGLKQLPGLFFVTFYGPGPCNDTTFLAAKDPKYANFGTLSPNPVSAQFSVALPSEVVVQVAVTDITGRRVQCPYKVSAEAVQFDADALSPGLYFVLLQAESRRQAVYKFVKL